MTTINITTDIPTDINTLERLAAWALLALHDVNRGLYYKETDFAEGAVPVVSTGVVEAADGTDRLISRIAIPLDTAWRTDGTQSLWMFADDIREVTLPSAFSA